MGNTNRSFEPVADARDRPRAITDQRVIKWRALAPRGRGFHRIRGMRPRMAAAIRRALIVYDLDRCCAVWWIYRLHFGITGDVMLGLAAVTAAQERSRCAI